MGSRARLAVASNAVLLEIGSAIVSFVAYTQTSYAGLAGQAASPAVYEVSLQLMEQTPGY